MHQAVRGGGIKLSWESRASNAEASSKSGHTVGTQWLLFSKPPCNLASYVGAAFANPFFGIIFLQDLDGVSRRQCADRQHVWITSLQTTNDVLMLLL